MEGVVKGAEWQQCAVILDGVGRLLLFQQRPEQVHVLQLSASRDGIDVEIVGGGPLRWLHHLMRSSIGPS